MIECITVGDMIETNSFFYIDDETKHGFLIDAGAEGDRLAALSMLPKTVRAMRAIRGGTSPYGAARP